jgi:hypothetical protein
MDDIEQRLARIEEKLDALIAALAAEAPEEDDETIVSLIDGRRFSARKEGRGLG